MSRLLLPTLLVALTASACYSERLPPPTFRHSCGGDGECAEDESCISGLCQVPCTIATSVQDCGEVGQGSSYIGCINGVCTSVCDSDPDDSPCPGKQSCASFPGEDSIGICIEECTADSCPGDEICIEGFCAEPCDPTDPEACAEGETCLGVCVPDDLVGTDGGVIETGSTDTDTDTDTDTGDTDTGDTDTGDTE